MSYILDALKRSEQERHQDKMPSFSAESMIIQTNQKKAHWWPYALILVLILNAFVLFFFNREAISEPELQSPNIELSLHNIIETKQSAAKPLLAVPSNNVRRAPPSSVIKERSYIQPLKHASQIASSSDWQPVNSIESRSDDHLYGTTVDEGLLIKPKSKQSTQQDAVPENDVYSLKASIQINPTYSPTQSGKIRSNSNDEPFKETSQSVDNFIGIPLLTDLESNFQKNIPDLSFNSHIYSEKPGQRRVMINNFYLKEGQSFNGIQLIEIGEEFIKVSKNDTIFKLPVLRDWSGM